VSVATLLGISLTACGSSSTAGKTSASSETLNTAFPVPSGGELHVYNWTDYLDSNEITRFESETGIKVILDVFDSNETMLAKMQSGATGYDVIFPSDYMIAQMRELNLLQNVDVASFPNSVNIKPEMMNVYWDPGRKYTAPYMEGTTGIICDPVDPECARIKSWHDYFTSTSPKIGALKDQVEVVSAALRAVGVKATDLCTTDRAQYVKAQNLLKSFKPSIVESDGGLERLINGTNTVLQIWNGEAHRARSKKPDLTYIYPSDGVNQWADNMAIPVGAPDLDNAKIFINWLMDPKNIAAESNYTGYDNGITGSDAFMNADVKNDPAVVPPADVMGRITPTPNCSQDVRDLYTQVFTTWTSQL
jgi:spermidine/putrescine transport system substrate-binding protein